MPFAVDDQRGRHADRLDRREQLAGGVGVKGEMGGAGLLEESGRLVRAAFVDIDRNHIEILAAELGLAACRAPASPRGRARTRWPRCSGARPCRRNRPATWVSPSPSAKVNSGRSSGFGLSKSAAIGPLLRPASRPAGGGARPCASRTRSNPPVLAIVRRGETHIYRAESGDRRNALQRRDRWPAARRCRVLCVCSRLPAHARLAQAKTA